MYVKRHPFQGVVNIVWFNWHFYLLAFCSGIVLLLALHKFGFWVDFLLYIGLFMIGWLVIISLAASYYVYDYKKFYDLSWLPVNVPNNTIVNIHAGFDETSALLQQKFPNSNLLVLDFYDPLKHTEVSIKRARKRYPAFAGTIPIATQKIPLSDDSANAIFLILAAHEIRDETERIFFFKELSRVLAGQGNLYVVEHLRDLPNFIAYSIGFFHFHSKKAWLQTFDAAGFKNITQKKINPLITIFTLSKNGMAS